VQQFLFIFFCTCIVGGGHPLICPRNHLRGGCETVTPPLPPMLEPSPLASGLRQLTQFFF
jgi:hypothetical protein